MADMKSMQSLRESLKFDGTAYNNDAGHAKILGILARGNAAIGDMITDVSRPGEPEYTRVRIGNIWRLSDSSEYLLQIFFSIRNGWDVSLRGVGCLDADNRRLLRDMLDAWLLLVNNG